MSRPLTTAEIADLRAALPPIARGDTVQMPRATIERGREILGRLLEEVDRHRALLKQLEWSGPNGYLGGTCPRCGGEEGLPHKAACELAVLIGTAV